MFNRETLQDIFNRLQSPTYGAPSSELQLAALQEPQSTDRSVSFDSLKPAHLTTLRDTIQQLVKDATTVLALHTTLQTHIQRAEFYYQNATAALAPINRFPAEVLARIFVAGQHLEINFCPRISWIAKRWRGIALSTPELWSRIPLTSFARVSVYLERSGTIPIDIEVDARTYKVTTFALRQSIELLEQHAHRWRDIKVLLEEHEQAQLVIRPLENLCKRVSEGLSECRLNAIRFGVPYSPGLISNTYNSFLNISPIMNLRAIELLDVNLVCILPTSSSMFQQMHTLSLSSVENMHLDSHLFGALSAMPNLTSLVLDQCTFIIPQHAAGPYPEIILMELVTLELVHVPDETANLILSRIYAPNLQKFGWHSPVLEGPSPILDWATIRVRYPNLLTLRLRNVTSYATKHLLRWVENLFHLKSLTVIFGELLSPPRVAESASRVLQLLSKTKSPCCPELCKLTIGDLDENGLVHLQSAIEARPCLQTGRIAVKLQRSMQSSKKRKEFVGWANGSCLNMRIHELGGDGVDSDNGEESMGEDSESE